MAQNGVDIDCSAIHFASRNIGKVSESLSSLSSALGNTKINNSELTTASLIDTSKALVDGIMKTTVEDVTRKLTNTRNLIINNDKVARLFFQYVDQGILDENLYFTTVPLYDQRDYNDWYAGGTIASCGCGLTSMSMALSYIYNDILTPDKLVGLTDGHNNLESKMLAAAEEMDAIFTVDNSVHIDEFNQLLREGKMVISLVKDNSHFVLVTGMTEDGKYIVNDPYGAFQLDHPYTLEELNRSSSRAWIIDPYANVGNARTNIGKATISNDTARAILAANNGTETVSVTSDSYLRKINKRTGAVTSGFYNSTLAPTSIALQQGSNMGDIIAARSANSEVVQNLLYREETQGNQYTSDGQNNYQSYDLSDNGNSSSSSQVTTLGNNNSNVTAANNELLYNTGAEVVTSNRQGNTQVSGEFLNEATEQIKEFLDNKHAETQPESDNSSLLLDFRNESPIKASAVSLRTPVTNIAPVASSSPTPAVGAAKPTTINSETGYQSKPKAIESTPSFDTPSEIDIPVQETPKQSGSLDIGFFRETNEKISDIIKNSTYGDKPKIVGTGSVVTYPNSTPKSSSPFVNTPTPTVPESETGILGATKETMPKSDKHKLASIPVAIGGALAAGSAIAYTVGKKKKNEE